MTDIDLPAGRPGAARVAPREPSAVRALPRDKHNRPIPWFVYIDEQGNPDHRVVRAGGVREAVRRGLCWICGALRGREAAFVIGPMCAINRTSSEPPSHRECAKYTADACPFLSTPNMRRRERDLPENHVDPGGVMVMRNPGVACVWFTNKFTLDYPPGGGVLFDIGKPSRVSWRARGRAATRAEVLESIDSGFPLLEEAARADRDPAFAFAELERQREAVLRLLPAR